MATQDFDADFDSDSYTPSKMGRAKDTIKEGLSDVQRRFESSNINFDWKKIIPVALVGTLGAIVYSRRHRKSSHHLSNQSGSKSRKMASRKSHRAQA